MAETQDVNTLRRRGRRRLVGAIALVLLAAVVLPMVFDPEPPSSVPPVSLRIPAEDDTGFAPKVTPRPAAASAPVTPADPATTAAGPGARPEVKLPTEIAAPATETKRAAQAETPSAPAPPGPQAASPSPAASGEQYVVPVAALTDQAKVKDLVARLKAAKLPHYTEPLATAKGNVTRVRVGPYRNREAAEQAQRELQRLGLKPGKVLARS